MVGEGSGAAVLGDGADDRVVEAAPPELRDVLCLKPTSDRASSGDSNIRVASYRVDGRDLDIIGVLFSRRSSRPPRSSPPARGARAGLRRARPSCRRSAAAPSRRLRTSSPPGRRRDYRGPRALRQRDGRRTGIVLRTPEGGFESRAQRVPLIDAAPPIRTCGGRFFAPASTERTDVLRWVCLQPPETPRASVRSGSPAAERPAPFTCEARNEDRGARNEDRGSVAAENRVRPVAVLRRGIRA